MLASKLTRMGRPKKSEPTEQVRLPRSIVRRARRIAAHEGIDPGDLLAELVNAPLLAREGKMLDEVKQERKPK